MLKYFYYELGCSMEKRDSIITYVAYGSIKCNLKSLMQENNISKTKLVKKTGLHHKVIERYMTDSITKLDKDVLAKLCYILNCDLTELISYVKPKD